MAQNDTPSVYASRNIHPAPLADGEIAWHTLAHPDVFAVLHSTPEGLSSEEVGSRQQLYGYNRLPQQQRKHVLALFFAQFKDFMILVLVGAAVVSGIAGDAADVIIILMIVVLNAVIGFVQEYRAEKAMDALKKLAEAQSNVLRNGQVQTVASVELVPGDMVLLEAGNTVPADLRLSAVQGLKIAEAALTGESLPVDKMKEPLAEGALPLGDRCNMAYKGTQVTTGRGQGIVIATGLHSELGKIAQELKGEETATPLQKRMIDFGRKLSYLILSICAVLFGLGLLRGEEPLQMLLVAISLAVAAIPEALPALITIALSLGAKRLVKQQMLIRKLTAVETLGSVTYICTDKTGTLTQNKMTVSQTQPAEGLQGLHSLLTPLELGMALNHTVRQDGNELIGDPTETAMVDWVQKKLSQDAYKNFLQQFPVIAELPFDAERKCMTTVHHLGQGCLVLTKGAVEAIVQRLHNPAQSNGVLLQAGEMGASGMRVLAFAYRVYDEKFNNLRMDAIERDLQFAGLVGLMDPPREEAKAAIAECRQAGIKPVMITGDHKETAAAIARQIGLLADGGLVITGNELEKLTDGELGGTVESISVYARVSPEQKLRIVKALQEKGHFVAMTGDGVNDAPSLKRANIGIAMGITGTDVSKEAAHTILLDDNFATIIKAVREGRRIYDNIRRFVKYIMTCNGAEIWTIFLAPLLGLPLPLLPVHILWINLVTDGLPGLALSMEKAEPGIMRRPPPKPHESLFAEGLGFHIVWVGLLMAALTLGVQAWAVSTSHVHWQAMVFTVLSLSQLAHVFAVRSDKEFIYKKGLFSNPALFVVVLATCALQMVLIYLPAANRLFKTQPLRLNELLICLLLAAVVFHAVEGEKWIKNRMQKKKRSDK